MSSSASYTKVPALKQAFFDFLNEKLEDSAITQDAYDEMTGWFNQNTKKERKKRSPARNDDPNRVKRPVPASWMFRDENRQKIMDEHFDGEQVKGSMIAGKAKELWDSMSAEEKEPYETRHAEKWAAYKEANPSSTPTKPKVEFNFVEKGDVFGVPDGWEGPFYNKYLHKYADGYSIGVGRFATFEEAIEAAEKMENCGGITMDTGSRKGYTLRKSNDPQTDLRESPTGKYVSWTKKHFVTPKQPEKKTKAKKTKVPAKKVEKEPSEDYTDMPDLEPATASQQEDEPVVSKNEDAEKYDAETESESDDSDSDSEDEDGEELKVTEWSFKNKKYLVDTETNQLYDFDTQDPLKKHRKYYADKDTWKLKSNKD